MFKNSYDFPVYMSRSLAPERLNSNALPTSYVISKDKKIIMEKVGAANWNSEVVHNTLDRLLQ
jgi:hypothetical protein